VGEERSRIGDLVLPPLDGHIFREGHGQIAWGKTWIKQHLKVKHFFGTSDQAVENQLYIALLTFCVLIKLQRHSGYTGTLLELTRLLLACLHDSFSDFLVKLLRKPLRSSRGRRVLDHVLIFEHTYEQVMVENIDFLYDSTYDPIIL